MKSQMSLKMTQKIKRGMCKTKIKRDLRKIEA